MLKAIKMMVLLSVLSWGFMNVGVMAQSTTNLEDSITLSGESLEGIDIQSIDELEYEQNPARLGNLTLETEKESDTGDMLFEGLLEESKSDESPIYTIEKINTNKGDATDSHSVTIPITSFY